MPFLPSEPDNESMRACIGVNDLFSDIPPSVRLSCPPLTPPPRGDVEVERAVLGTVGANRPVVSFRGGGVYRHHVPAVVSSIVSRGEFATSYTPYQPEVSQGMLQSLYEYQCLMAELVGLPVVNASMYDWSTALAEAMLLCVRVTHRDAFAVPDTMSPQRRAVLGTYAAAAGVDIIDITHHPETGQMDLEHLATVLGRPCAGVYIESPSYLGFFEEHVPDMAALAHDTGALLCVGTDPLSCGLARAPGSLGADVVVGEASHLGNPVTYGGPLLGLFAVRDDMALIRMMPGRLIGKTVDADGATGYVMSLQTREQHIRRERATSNICTNEALCAVACAAYLAYLGPRGLAGLAEALMANARYAMRRLSSLPGWEAPVYRSFHFREFVASSPVSPAAIDAALAPRGLAGGIPVGTHAALYCITDLHTRDDIDMLCTVLEGL